MDFIIYAVGVSNLGNSNANIITIGKYVGFEIVRLDINLTAEYKKAKVGDFTLSDIRVNKYKGTLVKTRVTLVP